MAVGSLFQPIARTTDGPPCPRQCGRCRSMFPGDPDLFAGAIPDWWLCAPCRSILLPDTRLKPR